MSREKAIKYLVFALVVVISGCDFLENNYDYVERVPEVYHELGYLPKLISLLRQPIEVEWEEPVPNKFGQRSIVALMKFTPEDYDYIIKNSKKYDVGDTSYPIDFFNKWVDKSIADKMTLIEENGRYVTKGYKSMLPNLFTRLKGASFVYGDINPLASGYILVSLSND